MWPPREMVASLTQDTHPNPATATGHSIPMNASPPLVVDLDGTLTPTDTLWETLLQVFKRSPTGFLRVLLRLRGGKAAFKERATQEAQIRVEQLPYRTDLIEYLKQEKAQGRTIVLATAANHEIADRVAAHLGIFDHVMASSATINLKGETKLKAIQERYGNDFVYAGDSAADLPVWKSASAAVPVNASHRITRELEESTAIERSFPASGASFTTWIHAMRIHQWLKNLLIFVPVFTSFIFTDVEKLTTLALAFFSFSLTASGTYILNDLWDLENDRSHPRKQQRPFASGKIPIAHGLIAAISLIASSFLISSAVSLEFFLILALYLVLTTTYSWKLKERVLADVLMLSVLYTIRIVAGAIIVNVELSSWLMAFSVFLFFSLALVKRCTELVSLGASTGHQAHGRDYRVSDLTVLWPLGVGASLSAVVVFGLFISAPETQARYSTPSLLWLIALGLIYWLARVWIKTSRGEMHDDPVVFAIKDRGSRLTVLAMAFIMATAHFVNFGSEP